MFRFIILILKGIAMGAANVIPGVSGGTIALITNIYEDFINALKSCNGTAIKLLLTGQFKEFSNHINLPFLAAILLGIVISIFSIAKLFEFLLEKHPPQIWAFFFGLVLASVYYIAKTVSNWNWKNILTLLIGTAIALAISFLNPAPVENTNYLFIFICGVIGICGMILPGLSGSYILMLMGNYQLLMVTSINSLFDFLKAISTGNWNELSTHQEISNHLIYFILFLIGSVIGIIAFSHFIAWILKRYHDATLALLTGFVFGSLSIIWPWKKELVQNDQLDRHGEPMLIGYQRYLPEILTSSDVWIIACMLLGITSIVLIEFLANKSKA
ncbi:MAG: DUF368 domain-containing protein [Flavobacteriales bacterium]|nr:DUF368 domain-containing protein [Flavobacteriales bacterium]|tara:strand:- start:2298 stop:3284 length:987 start_codon:yes stop_codon:yes gene_type:complete